MRSLNDMRASIGSVEATGVLGLFVIFSNVTTTVYMLIFSVCHSSCSLYFTKLANKIK